MFIDTDKIEIYRGNCEDRLSQMDDESVQLIITSPPYNIGKEYENTQTIKEYLEWQSSIIKEAHRILAPTGSICWQVGNNIEKEKGISEVVPLDCLFYRL